MTARQPGNAPALVLPRWAARELSGLLTLAPPSGVGHAEPVDLPLRHPPNGGHPLPAADIGSIPATGVRKVPGSRI